MNNCKKSKFLNTCYSLKDLKVIARKFNESHQQKIKLSQKKLDLLNDLKNNITHCNNEECWMNSFFVTLEKNPFQPIQEDLTEKDIIDSLKDTKANYLGLNKSIRSYKDRSFVLFLFNDHWTCLVMKNNKFYYYDPIGVSPSTQIMKLIGNKNYIVSKKKDQKTKDRKCGYYVLKFIEKKFQK